ncbi:6-O-methylguanine DNA methyltransferase DNA binding domain [Carpediemonas membranifera]|uniref:Methylated-DNA--protein-cysteine methyltransferase n=1 Tax=Carpediemonas membranifera TaxID=201153 RepID=A0A8J6DYY6_9EUKA|nr:6-O-methylguanine DNA methyltransferase DNA binding domain [Carpediemonas membranifera]|eukprot:KAG9389993.1 6-O-methylguanine DNA methyltransferase DNA binding domain [Carpediemonas membranifera]
MLERSGDHEAFDGVSSDELILHNASTQLGEYFSGKREVFDLKFNPSGTEHQRRVWEAMQGIKLGQTMTYGEIAAQLGSSARAVGAACGRNPIPLMIPCHRVVGAAGLGGYSWSGGVQTKEKLLDFESRRDPSVFD